MSQLSLNHNFNSINSHLYIGRIGEHILKLILTLNEIDVYTPEIDKAGIDFVAKLSNDRFIKIQVKTPRLSKTKYIYSSKIHEWEKLKENLYMAIVLLEENNLKGVLLINSLSWKYDDDKNTFCDREYVGKKSTPEWGLNLGIKNIEYLLSKYEINKVLQEIK